MGPAEMLQNWMIQRGFIPYTEDELYELDLPEEETIQVTWALVDVLIAIVQDLHSSGFIRRKFGRDIPIIIHELEYYKRILDQNMRANGAGIVRKFIDYWETDFGWK